MLPLPIYYAAGGDAPLTIRVMSPAIALKFQAVEQIANVWLGWLALLMLGLLAWLSYPIQLLSR